MMTTDEESGPINPQVQIGHVHLKVADLERALKFYCGVLGGGGLIGLILIVLIILFLLGHI
jgi:extradiol dioxygenase family protein